MKIHNEFNIPLPPDQAWKVLNDIPRVAECVPGAALLEQREDSSYVGTVAVRLGPVALSFKGVFAYKEIDETLYRVRAEAKGSEQKARGSARADVEFVLSPDARGTKVSVDTDVELAGSIAQYARGGTLVQSTAQVLMNQFAKNLAKEFEGRAPAAEPQSVPAGDQQPVEPAAASRPIDAGQRRAAPAELSGLTLLWQGLWHAFSNSMRSVFRRGS